MVIRPQNMPQTSNSLLSPLNLWLLWATNGYHGLAVCTFKVLRLSTTHMGIRSQNMPQTSNSLLSPTKSMVARENQW